MKSRLAVAAGVIGLTGAAFIPNASADALAYTLVSSARISNYDSAYVNLYKSGSSARGEFNNSESFAIKNQGSFYRDNATYIQCGLVTTPARSSARCTRTLHGNYQVHLSAYKPRGGEGVPYGYVHF